MQKICGNCEQSLASLICQQCEGDDAFFCAICWRVHTQVKIFKLHTCLECKSKESKISMLQKGPQNDSILIKSNLDTQSKIKVVRFDDDTSSRKSDVKKETSSQVISEISPKGILTSNYKPLLPVETKRNSHDVGLISKAFHNLHNIIDSITLDIDYFVDFESLHYLSKFGKYGSMACGILLSLLLHILGRIMFGRFSIFIIIGIGIVGMRFLKNRTYSISSVMKSIEKVSLTSAKSGKIMTHTLCIMKSIRI
jgi:hypothetical protein